MRIRLIDVPIDLGASERGVSLGPTAIRLAGLEEKLQLLGHRLEEDSPPIRPNHCKRIEPENSRTKFLSAIKDVCLELHERVYQTACEGIFPIILGGDHSLAMGSITGISRYQIEKNKILGVLWIDAHGDYNTPETTPSGNLHGMPLAIINGLGDERFLPLCSPGQPTVLPQNTVLIGTRDLDPGERDLLRTQNVNVLTMMHLDQHGVDHCVHRALAFLENCDFIHVSLDMDCLDPSVAPGVGTPVGGGLTLREAHYILERLAETGKVCSLDLVEVNPLLDIKNQSARIAVELVGSILGSRTI